MEMTYMATVGTRVRELRTRKGWTQEKFAEIANVAISSVVNTECGLHPPRASTIKKYAKAFGVAIEDVTGGSITGRNYRSYGDEKPGRTYPVSDINDSAIAVLDTIPVIAMLMPEAKVALARDLCEQARTKLTQDMVNMEAIGMAIRLAVPDTALFGVFVESRQREIAIRIIEHYRARHGVA